MASAEPAPGLCCALGNSHPITTPSRGPSTPFSLLFGAGRKGGKTPGYPKTSSLSLPSPPAMRHLPLLHRRCRAGDDRLCTDVPSMIIIIILPRIHDERDDYGGSKDALGSRGCRQRDARCLFLFPPQPSPADALGFASGPAIA